MSVASVRYIVDDVEEAVGFYTRHLGFAAVARPGPGFAIVGREGLRMLLSAPSGPGGAAAAAADGRRPAPGGWNRIQLQVDDVEELVAALSASGVSVRTGPVRGRGGTQAVVDDPAGNPIELFQPASA